MFSRRSLGGEPVQGDSPHEEEGLLQSLTYISRSMLPSSQRTTEWDAIVAVARVRNAALGVTGALMASSYTFAQILEGSAQAIDVLMASILRDPRHREVKIVSLESGIMRKFPAWTMAFAGHAHYIDQHVEMLLDPLYREAEHSGVADLQNLMKEFSQRLT